MMTLDSPTVIATALLTSSGFARVALTAPNERLREAAAAELAYKIIAALEGSEKPNDPRQMTLPL
ncbi:hypothetical protein QUA95_30595 [Microcoleus sp. F10_A2]